MAERRRGGRWTTDFYGRDDDAEALRNRQAFLDALAADAPEVLAALRDRGLPAYQAATRRVRRVVPRLRHGVTRHAFLTRLPEATRGDPAAVRAAFRQATRRLRANQVGGVIRAAMAGRWALAAAESARPTDPRLIAAELEAVRAGRTPDAKPTAELEAAQAAAANARLTPLVGDLRTALNEWAARFGLQAPWLLDRALVTLKDWSLAAAPPAPLRFTPLRTEGAISPMPRRRRRLLFLHDGWDPARETAVAARTRLIAAFTRHLDRHLARVEALTARLDPEGQPVWRPMTERRARGPKRSPVDPFRLLAMYQADPSVSRAALARRVGLTLRGVTMLLRDAAQRVGLQLRPRARPGRPRRRSSP